MRFGGGRLSAFGDCVDWRKIPEPEVTSLDRWAQRAASLIGGRASAFVEADVSAERRPPWCRQSGGRRHEGCPADRWLLEPLGWLPAFAELARTDLGMGAVGDRLRFVSNRLGPPTGQDGDWTARVSLAAKPSPRAAIRRSERLPGQVVLVRGGPLWLPGAGGHLSQPEERQIGTGLVGADAPVQSACRI